ncbi:hypothetical protein JCM15765_31510 [Paradesulfitobacterium aromaticivorans]
MVKKKRLLLILTIIFTLIPYVVSAQPPVKHVISSSIESDEDVVLDNLPLTPKIVSSAIDKDGKQIPLHTKAKHKLIRKYVQDGETHYIGQTDLEVPVNIQNVTESGIAHLLSPTIAYANSGSGTDTVISTITQHETAYWEYVYGSTGDLRYYKWTGMTGYWTRGETRYYTHDAHFQTAAMGVKVEGGSFVASATSSDYYPYFSSSSPYTSNTIGWWDGEWANWPYIYPSESFQAQLYGTVYGSWGYITTINSSVGWF